MTQKEELAEALAKIEGLESKLKAAEGLQAQLDTANSTLKAAETARDAATSRAEKAESDLAAANTRADNAEKDAKAQKEAAGKAAKEAGDAKASEQTMREQLAARGIKPATVQKSADANENANGNDIATLEEQFMNASINDKREMLAGPHGDRLRAHARKQAAQG